MSENVNVPQWRELCKWERSYQALYYLVPWARNVKKLNCSITILPKCGHNDLTQMRTQWSYPNADKDCLLIRPWIPRWEPFPVASPCSPFGTFPAPPTSAPSSESSYDVAVELEEVAGQFGAAGRQELAVGQLSSLAVRIKKAFMLTLKSRCIMVVIRAVLKLRMEPNC